MEICAAHGEILMLGTGIGITAALGLAGAVLGSALFFPASWASARERSRGACRS